MTPERTAPPRGATARSAARREHLFDELVRLLLAEGFRHLTLDDLAARLHCSKRTLYGLAGSKEQLVRAVVVHFFRTATSRVEAAVPAAGTAPERLAAYLSAVARELAPASVAFFEDVAAFPPAAEVYERNTRAASARVRQVLEDGVARGELRPVDVAFAADVTAATMSRIQRRQTAAATGLEDAAAYAELTRLLLHGLELPREP